MSNYWLVTKKYVVIADTKQEALIVKPAELVENTSKLLTAFELEAHRIQSRCNNSGN